MPGLDMDQVVEKSRSEAKDMATVAPSRLRVRNVSKRFGNSVALDDAYIEMAAGEIHALVGQNGSGKSTLVKVLSGYWKPDDGALIEVDGQELSSPISPRDLRRTGLAFVHQGLGLVDQLSVFNNVRVGQFKAGRISRAIKRKDEGAATTAALLSLGCGADTRMPVGQLAAADQARVAIARAIQDRRPGGGLLVLDEATRALPHEATAVVHAAIRQISREGTAVMLVSHRLDEVLQLADRVTVLRDGRVVHSGVPVMGMSESVLETMILGAEAAPLGARTREPASADQSHVRVENLTGGLIRGVSFNMRRGEILGLSGVAGEGYEQVPYLLSGADAPTGGSLGLGEREFDLRGSSYVDLLAAGVALVPERRDALGLVGSCTIRENITLPRVRSHNSRLLIKRDWERGEAEQVVNMLSVDTHDSEKLVVQLSGGNAQKILLGKWLLNQPDFLILHEPTQGVDVGARRDLLRALRAMADAGCCVLVVSGESEDLATMCDRILIIRNGVVGDELIGYRSPELIVAALYGEGGGQ